MRENRIEAYLKEQVENELGGKCLKFVSPGEDGWHDRLLLLPMGRVAFVEVKAPGEEPTSLQAKRTREAAKLGHIAGFVDSFFSVDRLIMRLKRG